jgi:hypothetical protein
MMSLHNADSFDFFDTNFSGDLHIIKIVRN